MVNESRPKTQKQNTKKQYKCRYRSWCIPCLTVPKVDTILKAVIVLAIPFSISTVSTTFNFQKEILVEATEIKIKRKTEQTITILLKLSHESRALF